MAYQNIDDNPKVAEQISRASARNELLCAQKSNIALLARIITLEKRVAKLEKKPIKKKTKP